LGGWKRETYFVMGRRLVGSGVLENRFPRLFSLFDNKEAKLSECGV